MGVRQLATASPPSPLFFVLAPSLLALTRVWEAGTGAVVRKGEKANAAVVICAVYGYILVMDESHFFFFSTPVFKGELREPFFSYFFRFDYRSPAL